MRIITVLLSRIMLAFAILPAILACDRGKGIEENQSTRPIMEQGQVELERKATESGDSQAKIISGARDVDVVKPSKVGNKEQLGVFGKPNAPIRMVYELDREPAIGGAVAVSLVFVSSVSAQGMSVSFHLDEGLQIAEGDMRIAFGEQQPGQENAYRLSVVPQIEGLFYVNASVTLDWDGFRQTRAFAVPISIGQVSRRKSLPVSDDLISSPENQKVVPMTAQQEIQK